MHDEEDLFPITEDQDRFLREHWSIKSAAKLKQRYDVLFKRELVLRQLMQSNPNDVQTRRQWQVVSNELCEVETLCEQKGGFSSL